MTSVRVQRQQKKKKKRKLAHRLANRREAICLPIMFVYLAIKICVVLQLVMSCKYFRMPNGCMCIMYSPPFLKDGGAGKVMVALVVSCPSLVSLKAFGRLDWFTGHQTFKLENEQHNKGMVDQHYHRAKNTEEGRAGACHAHYVGDLKRAKYWSLTTT